MPQFPAWGDGHFGDSVPRTFSTPGWAIFSSAAACEGRLWQGGLCLWCLLMAMSPPPGYALLAGAWDTDGAWCL